MYDESERPSAPTKEGRRVTARDAAAAFVKAINSHALDRIAALMTDDHVFIDSDGTRHQGKDRMREGWRGYLALVPDYRVIVEETFGRGQMIILLGEAEGTFVQDGRLEQENHWRVPAAWRVVVKNGKVSIWQLYVNPEPMATILKRISGK